MSQEVSLIQLQHKGKKPANQSPPEKHPQRVTSSEERTIPLGSEKTNVLTNKLIRPHIEDGDLQHSEKKFPPGRIPSNVKKMIRSFESGLAQVFLSVVTDLCSYNMINILLLQAFSTKWLCLKTGHEISY